jgi:hypothetical protein
MPFRRGYESIYDRDTLDQLQEVFDAVWLIVLDAGVSLRRDDIVRMILHAHEAGMSPTQIRQHVIYEVLRKPETDH